jgi:hypothetical protein
MISARSPSASIVTPPGALFHLREVATRARE